MFDKIKTIKLTPITKKKNILNIVFCINSNLNLESINTVEAYNRRTKEGK